jgi:hypothetical protein
MFHIEHNTEISHVFTFQAPEEVVALFDEPEGVELDGGNFDIAAVREPGEPAKLRLTVMVRETKTRGDTDLSNEEP